MSGNFQMPSSMDDDHPLDLSMSKGTEEEATGILTEELEEKVVALWELEEDLVSHKRKICVGMMEIARLNTVHPERSLLIHLYDTMENFQRRIRRMRVELEDVTLRMRSRGQESLLDFDLEDFKNFEQNIRREVHPFFESTDSFLRMLRNGMMIEYYRVPLPGPVPLIQRCYALSPECVDMTLAHMLLSAVCDRDYYEAARLLDRGAPVNVKDPTSMTSVHVACIHCEGDVLDLLLERGADVNLKDKLCAPLHYAAFFDRKGVIIARLLEAGADVDLDDAYGRKPLHWAALGDNATAARALVAAGAAKDASDCDGMTAFRCARSATLSAILEY